MYTLWVLNAGDILQTGMEALAQGGTFALVGMGADCCPQFPMSTLVTKEADFRGCFRYTNIVSSCNYLSTREGVLLMSSMWK